MKYCSIYGCQKPVHSLNLCSKHRSRLKRNGDPLITRSPRGNKHCNPKRGQCPAQVRLRNQLRYLENPEYYIDSARSWRNRYPGLSGGRRKTAIKTATPPWLNSGHWAEIASIYEYARIITKLTKVQHSVDHIIPLRAGVASGLHVPWNLRVVTSSKNNQRKKKFSVNELTELQGLL